MTSIGGPLGVLLYDANTNSTQYLNAAFNDPIDKRQKWNAENAKIGTSALVPGAIAGLEALSKKYGRLSFEMALAPAIALAQNGFPLSSHYADLIRAPMFQEKLKRTAYGRRTFFRDGQPLKEGEILKLPELAGFLRKLAANGSAYAYRGAWAEEYLKTVKSNGGHLSAEDFQSYQPIWETTLHISYRGYELFFPKTHGSIIASMALKIAEPANLKKFGEHYTSSAEGLAFVDLAYVAASRERWLYDYQKLEDEDFLKSQLSVEHIAELRAWEEKQLGGHPMPDKGTHSLQVTVIDQDGNAVTGTNTIEGMPWGEGLFVEGVPLSSSNELSEFATAPGHRRTFGLAMHIATRNNRVKIASGTFNSSLIPAEFQILLNLINYEMSPIDAVTAPRLGVSAWSLTTRKPTGGQWLDPRVDPAIADELGARGLRFTQVPPVDTGLGAVAVVSDDGAVRGAIAPLTPPAPERMVGIGAALEATADHEIRITKILPDSPAGKAGIAAGDIIVTVQSMPQSSPIEVRNLAPQDVVRLIRGVKGTPLVLLIMKPGGERVTFELTRDEVGLPPK